MLEGSNVSGDTDTGLLTLPNLDNFFALDSALICLYKFETQGVTIDIRPMASQWKVTSIAQ